MRKQAVSVRITFDSCYICISKGREVRAAVIDKVECMQLFCRCAELGSISAAAREAGRAQSQVSRAIKSLESAFGVTLLIRTTRSVRLTAEGEEAIRHFRDALDSIDRARDAISGEVPSGLLRVTAPVGYGHSVIAPVVRKFLASAPNARADLDLTDSFVDLASSGHDVAVRIGPVDGQTLRIVSLGRCPMRVVVAPQLAARLGVIETPEDLAGMPCLAYSSWRAPSEWIFERRGHRVTVRVNGRLSSTHLPSLLAAALDGMGLANLPLWLVQDDLKEHRLQTVLGDWQVVDQPIHAVLPPGRHTPVRARVFVDLLRRSVRETAQGV